MLSTRTWLEEWGALHQASSSEARGLPSEVRGLVGAPEDDSDGVAALCQASSSKDPDLPSEVRGLVGVLLDTDVGITEAPTRNEQDALPATEQ